MALISTLAATHLNPGICNALVQFIWTEYHQTVTRVVQLPTNIDEPRDDGLGRRSSRKPIGQGFLGELSYRMSRRKPFRKRIEVSLKACLVPKWSLAPKVLSLNHGNEVKNAGACSPGCAKQGA